jgi:predicted ABC-type ATPase
VLDPDAIARIANAPDPSRAAIAAGREVLSQWRQFIDRRISFAIETTLAGIGPLERIRQARIVGVWSSGLLRCYRHARTQRRTGVRRRVLQGGHGIPERDIRRRYDRSLANAPVVLTLADRASVLDNSFHQTVTVAELNPGAFRGEPRTCPRGPRGFLPPLSTEFAFIATRVRSQIRLKCPPEARPLQLVVPCARSEISGSA